MKTLLSVLLFLLLSNQLVKAQQKIKLTFVKQTDTIARKSSLVIFPITLHAESSSIPKDSLKLYTVSVKTDDEKSTLPTSAYSLSFNSTTLDKISPSYTLYLTLKPDTLVDRNRILYFSMEITKDGKPSDINFAKDKVDLSITVQSNKALAKYNYLAYVGTNFDMIDGVKANDLFFATNIFVSPQGKNLGFGFNILMYGNRTFTSSDAEKVSYTSKIVGIGGDSARSYFATATKTVSRVSDNLGASFSPLIRLGAISDPNRITKIYYAPQFEFIWRRSKITTSYKDEVITDSLDRPNRPINGTLVLTPATSVTPVNIYDLYLGLMGFSLNHENSEVSIRFQAVLGANYNYTQRFVNNSSVTSTLNMPLDRNLYCFYYLRTWITEATSGITIGAEVSNNLFNKAVHQPYYNVTLSKAFNLSALGSLFKSVGSR